METAEMVQTTASFMAERKQIITKDGNISAVDSIPRRYFHCGATSFSAACTGKGAAKKTGLLVTENMLFHNPANTLLRFFTASSHPRRVPTGRSGAKRVS